MFIVADEESIDLGSDIDAQHMREFAADVAAVTHFKLDTHYFKKEDVSAKQLVTEITQMDCGSDDVIMFYYAGHGLNSSDGRGQLPSFRIENTDFSQEWVSNQFERTHARLVITMFDCCNRVPAVSESHCTLQDNKFYNYIALFGESEGVVKLTSVQAGEQGEAWGRPEKGSLYTNSFLESFRAITTKVSYDDCTWKKLAQMTSETTQAKARAAHKEQVPYSEIDIVRYKQFK